MTKLTLALLALLCGGVSVPHQPNQPALQGDWIGQINYGAQWQRVNFHFTRGPGGPAGTLDLPTQDRYGLPVKQVTVDSARVYVEWEGRSGLATFDGRLKDGEISGEFAQGQNKATFRVVRVAKALADLTLYGKYAGSYQLGPDRFVDLAPFGEDEDRPIFFDSKTRRTGVLYGLSDSDFFTGPSYGVMFPASIRVTFVTDGQGVVSGLRWQESACPLSMPRG